MQLLDIVIYVTNLSLHQKIHIFVGPDRGVFFRISSFLTKGGSFPDSVLCFIFIINGTIF